MHLVHVIARLNDGGPARVLANLAQVLQARGHRLTILSGTCHADEPDLTARLRTADLAIETVPGLGRRIAPWSDLQAFLFILRRLRALKPDVVHTHTAKAGVLGRMAGRWLNLPCLHTYHGHVLSGYFGPLGSTLVRWVERACAGGCHHQALTASQVVELRDHHRIGRPKRWHELPIPVTRVQAQVAEWQQRLVPGLPVVGFLGRLAPVKDVDLWLDTLVELNRLRPVQGLVCGDGVGRSEAEQRARQLGVPVLFTGFVPAGEALQPCAVLLITSRNEGLPVAAVEACGIQGRGPLPVVAPPVGGLADLIASGAVNGAERSAVALATACAEVLKDPSWVSAHHHAAERLAASLEPSALADRYDALYRDIACAGSV